MHYPKNHGSCFIAAAPCRRGCGVGLSLLVPVGRRPCRPFRRSLRRWARCLMYVFQWLMFHVEHCGVYMSGFVSGGCAFGAGVVLRVSGSGWVWACRARSSVLNPAPACLFVPFASRSAACAWAQAVAASLGWRAWVRPARRCVSAFEVKLALPAGLSAQSARAALPPVVG